MASDLTRWGVEQDAKLFIMMQYIHTHGDLRSIGFIGDPPDKLNLMLFCDADHAGCKTDMKSTSGVLLILVGDHSFYPLGFISKKQGAQSHSTVEAEIVAVDAGLRMSGIPALDLWETILPHSPTLTIAEDNQATAQLLKTGKFPTLRHVKRVQGISICFNHEMLKKDMYSLLDCHTKHQAADIFTKHFTDETEWLHGQELIGIVKPSNFTKLHKKTKGKSTSCVARCRTRKRLPPACPQYSVATRGRFTDYCCECNGHDKGRFMV
jgi:hypothetical protein